MMEYKGYFAKVEFDDDDNIFHGEVINLRDVITFEGETVTELKKAFHDSVDDYLEELKPHITGLKTHIDTGRIHFIDSISYRAFPEKIPKNTFYLDHASDLLTLSVTIDDLSGVPIIMAPFLETDELTGISMPKRPLRPLCNSSRAAFVTGHDC